jgi:23S rRNA-/tRNA-specific pseudouridylate synthase
MPATYSLPARAAMISQLLEGDERKDMLPCIRLELRNILVIHKPPGWEIDVQHFASARRLSFWLERILSNMLCFQPHDGGVHSIGFIHRLDAPCSGILLVSQTHDACYFLQWQLHVDALIRDYAVHCYG